VVNERNDDMIVSYDSVMVSGQRYLCEQASLNDLIARFIGIWCTFLLQQLNHCRWRYAVAMWYGAGGWCVVVYQCQLSVPSLQGRLMSTSEIWGVNGHTTRFTSSVTVVSRLRLVSGWGLHKTEISAADKTTCSTCKKVYKNQLCTKVVPGSPTLWANGPMRLGKYFTLFTL